MEAHWDAGEGLEEADGAAVATNFSSVAGEVEVDGEADSQAAGSLEVCRWRQVGAADGQLHRSANRGEEAAGIWAAWRRP